MPEHVSILQLLSGVVLVLAAVLWTAGFVRIQRQYGRGHLAARGRAGGTLGAVPPHRSAPRLESVELTPAERDAFAGLVRQFGDGRP